MSQVNDPFDTFRRDREQEGFRPRRRTDRAVYANRIARLLDGVDEPPPESEPECAPVCATITPPVARLQEFDVDFNDLFKFMLNPDSKEQKPPA